MILSFFHDHKFMVYNENVYTTGTLSSNIWKRYLLDSVDSLIICARQVSYQEEQISDLSSCKNVTFEFSHDLSSITNLFYRRKRKLIKNVVRKSDLVISRLPSEIGLAACDEALRQNKPFVCEVVGCPYDALSGYGSLKAFIYAPVLMLRMKRAVKKSTAAIYVTEHMLQKKYPGPSLTTNISNVQIENVIGEEVIPVRVERFKFRKNAGKLKIGLIGSVKNKIKGVDLAIDAFSELDGCLHVIGSGDPTEFFELAKNVGCEFSFDGFLTKTHQVLEWLDDIDIYIQPSLQEGLPRATIEAMSRGCPVLSSNAGGLPELTLEKYIHDKGNAELLKRQLQKFISISEEELIDAIRHSILTANRYLIETLSHRRTEFLNAVIKQQVFKNEN